jgi:hypothetical protein
MRQFLHEIRLSVGSIQALVWVLVIAAAVSRGTAQVGTGKPVIQKATEQFENSPLKTTSLGNGLFFFSGTEETLRRSSMTAPHC